MHSAYRDQQQRRRQIAKNRLNISLKEINRKKKSQKKSCITAIREIKLNKNDHQYSAIHCGRNYKFVCSKWPGQQLQCCLYNWTFCEEEREMFHKTRNKNKPLHFKITTKHTERETETNHRNDVLTIETNCSTGGLVSVRTRQPNVREIGEYGRHICLAIFSCITFSVVFVQWNFSYILLTLRTFKWPGHIYIQILCLNHQLDDFDRKRLRDDNDHITYTPPFRTNFGCAGPTEWVSELWHTSELRK